MSKFAKIFVFICGIFLSAVPAMAATQQSATSLLQASMGSSMDAIFHNLQGWALGVLGSFILIQFTWTNIRQLLDGADLDRVMAKLFGSVFWFGICAYIFNNGPDFIKAVSSFLLQKATTVSGASFDPAYPIDLGIAVASSLLEALDNSQSVLASLNPFPSIMMGLVACVILAVAALVSFKIFMLFIETKIVIALSPLSFALLGLDAFKDQGFAPFKYLVALAYRAMILAAVLTAMAAFSQNIIASFAALPAASDPSVWPPIWAAAIGYALLGALALRADSIAAMLASGSSNMSPGDAAAVGAAAGAAAGVAVGGTSKGIDAAHGAAGMAGSGIQTMGDFMKSLASSCAVKNESGRGSGGNGNFDGIGPMAASPSLKTGGSSAGGSSSASGKSGQADSAASSGAGVAVPSRQDNSYAGSDAAAGVASSGGSVSAGAAASSAAMAGGSNEQIASAVLNSGGTANQAAAAAVATAMGDVGAPQGSPAMRAGIDAASKGGSPGDIAKAIYEAGGTRPEQIAGSRAAADAAKAAGAGNSALPGAVATSRPEGLGSSGGTGGNSGSGAERHSGSKSGSDLLGTKNSAGKDSGANAGIAGNEMGGGSLAETLAMLSKKMDNLDTQKSGTMSAQLKDLSDHITRDSTPVHISMNTHQS